MADYQQFGFGGANFPLTTAGSNSLLRDADPAVYWALQFYQQTLETHIAPRLVAEAAACGASSIKKAVGATAHYDPAPYLTSGHPDLRYPILALYRQQGVMKRKTASWDSDEQQLEVAYILPGLNNSQAARLLPILHAVELVLKNRTSTGLDPTFQASALVWRDLAGLEEVDFSGPTRYGVLPNQHGLAFYAWTGRIRFRERLRKINNVASKFAGSDIEIDIASPEQPTVAPFIQIDQEPAPTVSLCVPNSGTAAGGTAITLTGTGFHSGATVTIGGVAATSVVFASATTLTAVTGAMSILNGGVVPNQVSVVVQNPDLLSGKLPLGFTYT